MNVPQRHRGHQQDLPQRHGGTEHRNLKQPRPLGGTELIDINLVTQRIIGCAIEVHRVLGPGLLESIYESALRIEMNDAALTYERQVIGSASYKGYALGHCRIDLVVNNLVVVDIKSALNVQAHFFA